MSAFASEEFFLPVTATIAPSRMAILLRSDASVAGRVSFTESKSLSYFAVRLYASQPERYSLVIDSALIEAATREMA